MRIGIITAMAEETYPILNRIGNIIAQNTISGVNVCKAQIGAHTLYLATGGVGEIRAAMTAQLLKDLFDVEVMLNFGFVGALDPSLKQGELVLARRVCHYQFDSSAIDGTQPGQYDGKDDRYFYLDAALLDRVLLATRKSLRQVTVASGDLFVASSQTKSLLRDKFGGDICEMELAALALVCERNDIPLLSLKVVSDCADESSPESFPQVVANAMTKYEELLPDIIAAVAGEVSPLPPSDKTWKMHIY